MLADLKMPGALEELDTILQGVDGGSLTAEEAIEELLGAQITLRNNRRLQAAMRSSRLPVVKMLEDFDFTFQPSIKREPIESLHELGFFERRENVILLGSPVVGKTHLAISLAIRAAQNGRRVYYGTLADLITSLEEAQAGGTSSSASRSSPIRRSWWSTRSATCRSPAPDPCSSSSPWPRRYETASTVSGFGTSAGAERMAGWRLDPRLTQRIRHPQTVELIRGAVRRVAWARRRSAEARRPRGRTIARSRGTASCTLARRCAPEAQP